MKTILAICKKDFSSDLYSGKSFISAFFFLIFMGSFFYYYTDSFISVQQANKSSGQPAPDLFMLVASVYGVLHFVLILLIPSLTMGSFALERQSDSLRYLLAAPISSFQVVLGKYLSVLLTAALIFVGSLIFPLFLVFHSGISGGFILSVYLGLFLLSASHLAFGLWISSLCKTQFSAFLFTMAGLFFLLLANMLAASIKGFSTLHLLVKYLGASGHFSSFLKGIISLSDIVYFLAFMLLFLFLTILSYDSYRWR